jgi:hypothetical protein
MTVATKRVTAAVSTSDEDANGSFEILLSTATRDREGEIVSSKSWALPLPATIPINVDHSPSVSDVIGSGRPFLDSDGNLRVKGTFASTAQAQHVRSLVAEGHLRSVSVEFLRTKGADGQPVNELVGGAFVSLPANPEARVLASKAAFQAGLDAILSGKSMTDAVAMTQAIHDASAHMGAQCVVPVGLDDDLSEDGDDGESDGANKAAALRLRLKPESTDRLWSRW